MKAIHIMKNGDEIFFYKDYKNKKVVLIKHHTSKWDITMVKVAYYLSDDVSIEVNNEKSLLIVSANINSDWYVDVIELVYDNFVNIVEYAFENFDIDGDKSLHACIMEGVKKYETAVECSEHKTLE